MTRFPIAKVLAGLVVITGTVVLFGWILDIPVFKSILPFWVTMKFTTAASFLMSGMGLYAIAEFRESGSSIYQVVLPVTTLIIFLLMTTLLVSTFFGIHTGIENLFVRESAVSVRTTIPGRPAVATMIAFIFIGMAGIFTMLNPVRLEKILWGIGFLVSLAGAVAFAGYVMNLPFLYYAVEGWSTAMAFHTAILFILWGLGLILASQNVQESKK